MGRHPSVHGGPPPTARVSTAAGRGADRESEPHDPRRTNPRTSRHDRTGPCTQRERGTAMTETTRTTDNTVVAAATFRLMGRVHRAPHLHRPRVPVQRTGEGDRRGQLGLGLLLVQPDHRRRSEVDRDQRLQSDPDRPARSFLPRRRAAELGLRRNFPHPGRARRRPRTPTY